MKATGFTLIEVAILLVIIGFIATSVLNVVGAVTEARRSDETERRFTIIEHALQSYVEQFGCFKG